MLSSTNFAEAATRGAAATESLLRLAELPIAFAQAVTQRRTDTFTTNCRNGGIAEVVLTDADQNLRATAGDSLRVTLRDCYVQALDDVAAGEFSFTFEAPAAGVRESYAGVLRFGPGFATRVQPALRVEVDGQLNVQWRREALLASIAATTVTPAGVAFSTVSNGPRVIETLKNASASKMLRYDSARVELQFDATLESQFLGGRIQIRTPNGVSAFFNTYPEQGLYRFGGAANATVELVPNFVVGSEFARVRFDDNGDGTIDNEATVPWQQITEGYLWWEPVSTPNVASGGFPTQTFNINDMRLLSFEPGDPVPVTAEIAAQFSRPLASPTPIAMRFFNFSSSFGEHVDADTIVQGARLTARPRSQLNHGQTYALQLVAGEFRDQFGNSAGIIGFPAFTTRNNLVAATRAMPLASLGGAPVELDGSPSTSTDGAIRRQRWRQIAGPAASISNPDSIRTMVTPAPSSPPGDLLVFELSVENDTGETDRELIALPSISIPEQAGILYYRSSAGDTLGQGSTAFLSTASGSLNAFRGFSNGITVRFQNSENSPGGSLVNWTVELAAPGNAALDVGAYENAERSGFQLQGRPGLAMTGSGRVCGSVTGRFDIYEVEYDGSGEVTRLAVDFEQRCGLANEPPLFGSIRYRSARPVRF